MFWYIILIMIIIFFGIFFKKNKKLFCISSGIMLWGMLAFRNLQIGLHDTLYVYKPFFETIRISSFYALMNSFRTEDVGFTFSSKILSYVITNYQIYIAIMAIPFIYLIVRFIYKKSESPLMSIIIFVSLYYLYGTFLLRQVIAIAILTLAMGAIEEKKAKKFIIYVIIASLFHKTALIFFIAYPFAKHNKFGKKNYLFILVAYILATFFFQYIFRIIPYLDFTGKIESSIKYEIYDTNGKVSLFGLFINVVIILFCDFLYKDKSDYKINVYLNIATLGAIFFTFSRMISECYRISLYFSIINVILIPYVCIRIEDKNKRLLLKSVLSMMFIVYFLVRTINNVNANPYIFFFN